VKRSPLTRKTPLRKVRPTQRRKGPTRKPVKTAAEREHHRRVALMPCLACGVWPVEVHHVRHDGRTSITRNHKLVIPLCSVCHRTGPNAVHTIGHPAFNELHGINQIERARRLWEA
jgi:hypothetical protein